MTSKRSLYEHFSSLEVRTRETKGKDKIYPRKEHKVPEGGVVVYLYSFFNLGARCGWMVNVTPRPLYPQERPGTHCIGGWMGSRAFRDGCRKSRPHHVSILGLSSS